MSFDGTLHNIAEANDFIHNLLPFLLPEHHAFMHNPDFLWMLTIVHLLSHQTEEEIEKD